MMDILDSAQDVNVNHLQQMPSVLSMTRKWAPPSLALPTLRLPTLRCVLRSLKGSQRPYVLRNGLTVGQNRMNEGPLRDSCEDIRRSVGMNVDKGCVKADSGVVRPCYRGIGVHR